MLILWTRSVTYTMVYQLLGNYCELILSSDATWPATGPLSRVAKCLCLFLKQPFGRYQRLECE